MNRNRLIAIGCLIAGLVFFVGAIAVQTTASGVVCATPDGPVAQSSTISWSMILSLLGGGSLTSAIMTILKKAAPIATEVIETISPRGAAAVKTVTDSVEVVQAVINFKAHPEDPMSQQRFAIACLAELKGISTFACPEFATALNALGQVFISRALPTAKEAPPIPGVSK